MADTAIPITALDGATDDVAGTAIVAADTHVITPTDRLDKVVIRLVNSTAATKVFTVEAGDSPPANAAGQGELELTLEQDDVVFLAGLESARYVKSDGTVKITVASATTGFITAFQLA